MLATYVNAQVMPYKVLLTFATYIFIKNQFLSQQILIFSFKLMKKGMYYDRDTLCPNS